MIIKQVINHHRVIGPESQAFQIKVPSRGTIHRLQIAQVSPATYNGFTWSLYNYRGAVGNLSRLVDADTESSSISIAGESLGATAIGRFENVPRHFFRLLHGSVGASAYDDTDENDDWLAIPVPYQNLDGSGPTSRSPYLYLEINTVDNDPTTFMSSLTISGVDP